MDSRKKWMAALALLATAIAATGCCGLGCGALPRFDWRLPSIRAVRGSGELVSRQPDHGEFTRLEISHAFQVYVYEADSCEITITVDDNIWDLVSVSRSGSTLRIGLDSETISINDATLQVDLGMPRLEGAELSGASRLSGEMDTGDVRFDISGASRLALQGMGGDLQLDASGASNADLGSFLVGNAKVEASGASQVVVHASGRLDVDASGASRVEYLGQPTLGRIESSGASQVRPR